MYWLISQCQLSLDKPHLSMPPSPVAGAMKIHNNTNPMKPGITFLLIQVVSPFHLIQVEPSQCSPTSFYVNNLCSLHSMFSHTTTHVLLYHLCLQRENLDGLATASEQGGQSTVMEIPILQYFTTGNGLW
jgi:hypothetical protein